MLQAILRDFDELLGCFVDDPSDGALVVSCEDMASGLLHAAIDSFDERREHDVGLAFSSPVDDIGDYVTGLALQLRVALQEADQACAADELPRVPVVPPDPALAVLFGDASGGTPDAGSGPVPTPPARGAPPLLPCTDDREADLFAVAEDPNRGPCERLEALIRALLLRLPEGDHRLLIALTPARIVDHVGYRQLLQGLLPLRAPRLRLVVRDERPPVHSAGLPEVETGRHPSQHLFDLPVDFPLLVASTRQAADDPRRPRHQRIAALLQLGFYELGHGEADASELCFLRSLDDLAKGPRPSPADPHLAALALYGRGALLSTRGETEEAKQLLLRAWTCARDSSPATKAPIALGLGRALVAENELHGGSVFLALAATCAVKAGAEELAASSLRELGENELTLGRPDEARDAWSLARELSSPSSELARELDRLLSRSKRG